MKDYRARQQQRMQQLIADRDAFIANKAASKTGLQHSDVDSDLNPANNADTSPDAALSLPFPGADGNNNTVN